MIGIIVGSKLGIFKGHIPPSQLFALLDHNIYVFSLLYLIQLKDNGSYLKQTVFFKNILLF